MKLEHSDIGTHTCHISGALALSLSKSAPMIAHLGIESGGRGRRHIDCNLLKPGLGGVPCGHFKPSGKTPPPPTLSETGILHRIPLKGGGEGQALFKIDGERGFSLSLSSPSPFKGEFFEMAFGNDVAPATIWAEPIAYPKPQSNTGSRKPSRKGTAANAYRLPSAIHFPDYGLLQVESDDASVECVEEVRPLPEMSGLCLGCKNNGGHNRMFALHHGCLRVAFRLKSPGKSIRLKFRVLDEVGPALQGTSLSDTGWDGLRRCWLNSFTLHKSTLTMGDNIALGGTAHLAMHFKSELLRFTPALPNGIKIHDFLRRAVEMSFDNCQADDGEINWDYEGKPKPPGRKIASFIDSTPSALIALCNLVKCEGYGKLARKHAAKAAKAAAFLMGLDSDSDGIIEVPFHGNFFDDAVPNRPRNWWDNFAFGHKDVYFNLLSHKALRLTAELLENAGRHGEAMKAAEFLTRFDSNFDRVFFNPATGVYAGWISADGRIHDYMFTFATAMAINEGLVESQKARKSMSILLSKLKEAGFGKWRYGIPGPCVPVDPRDTIDWDVLGKWPRYENGGLCGQAAFHFIQALYNCGMDREADEILFAMLDTFENEPTHSGLMPGYGKSVDWRTMDGLPCGYNYLADNYYFLLAAITGHFKARL